MNTLRTVAEIRRELEPHRRASRIALAPTMGALHAGHVALFEAARRAADVVVATIFVNPTQFGDQRDLASYPRDEAKDARVAQQAGVDVIFAPAVEEIYPAGYGTWIDMHGAAVGLEGEHRPGHFRGVATICLKLFTIVMPDVAFFGQKDAQQVAVIKQLVRDLNVPVEICVVPIVRDVDGLALSSRNSRLSPAERAQAVAIPRALEAGLAAHRAQRDPVAAARLVLDGQGGIDVDYVAVADFDGVRTLVIAARVGGTRLIDNAPLDA